MNYRSLKVYIKARIVESTVTNAAGKDIKYCTANHWENNFGIYYSSLFFMFLLSSVVLFSIMSDVN